jgi:chemosensory pili system protein ChpA (sensor histidine kinase/response regulator)
MAEDREKQLRLQFLDEAEEYLNNIESELLGFGSCTIESKNLEAILRATHSIKGGAAMMTFDTLSHFAHCLEDCFKVLKSGKVDAVNENLELLLLSSLDRLRQIITLNRQEIAIEESWLEINVNPIFDELKARLGEPDLEEEASLFSLDAQTEMTVLVFETEVEQYLLRLESLLNKLSESDSEQNYYIDEPEILSQLREQLLSTAEELAGLGEMLKLKAFTSFCQSLLQHLTNTSEQVEKIASVAIEGWRKAQSLILAGQINAIPSSLDFNLQGENILTSAKSDFVDSDRGKTEILETISPDLNFSVVREEDESSSKSLSELENWLEDSLNWFDASEPITSETEAENTVNSLNFTTTTDNTNNRKEILQSDRQQQTADNTVRVSVAHLERLNELFGELTIERNSMNLQLSRLRHLVNFLQQKISTLEKSNSRLETAYNQMATKVAVSELTSSSIVTTASNSPTLDRQNSSREMSENGSQGKLDSAAPGAIANQLSDLKPRSSILNTPEVESRQFDELSNFDSLEMESYTPWQPMSQEVKETIVQIQEITNDLELNFQEADNTASAITNTWELIQSKFNQVRMRPFGELVERFPRALRNLELEYGKQVKLKIKGGSTLIDRTIFEALNEPLLQLVRNAFAHGIEEPARRKACGKREGGTITISAAYRGNRIAIAVSDDGSGIDLEKIRAKALKIIDNTSQLTKLTDKDLLGLIFEPGFSTADEVTTLAGRGVGMDVVRTNLEEIGGNIQVDTKLGVGTNFTITVPFTLSVIRVLLIESNGMLLAFPSNIVEEMLMLEPAMILTSAGREFLNFEGLIIPLIRLSQCLNLPHSPQRLETEEVPSIDRSIVLMIAQGDNIVAIQADRYWREEEVSIRQVVGKISLPTGLCGCTLLGNGRVVPLVDVLALLNCVQGIDPIIAPNSSTPDSGAKERSLSRQSRQNGKSQLMIIDDSITIRRFLAMILKKANYQVEQAKDGQEALEKLKAGLLVDAIICDIEMPRLNGYGFLSQVKSNPQYQDIPVIMLTSRSGDKHRQLAMKLGATAYFGKPCQEQELLKTLKQLSRFQ